MNLLKYFAVTDPAPPLTDPQEIERNYKKARMSVFLSATIGYGLYYVCRLSLNVVKKPIVDAGVVSETELGVIGSALFVTYAVGKFTNGFLSDRSNIRRLLSLGLLISALVNIAMGFTTSFYLLVALWGINGWVQSMGAAPCVVALSRWYREEERGTFYGLWSSSHNIGEAITFLATAFLVSIAGWEWGLRGAGIVGLLGFVMIATFMRDTPESLGLPPVRKEESPAANEDDKSIASEQFAVLRNPAIWLLALSSACMYISRYAVNSWGIFYLEAEKGYTNLEASAIIAISSVCGIIGTISCGFVSDKFFRGSRNRPALLFGLMNVASLALFLYGPRGVYWIDAFSMVLFGLAIGALLCYLGGLMATDIASKRASGAALGTIGIASYAGAALQDIISGISIEQSKTMVDGVAKYDFSTISLVWFGAAILSVIFALGVWFYQANFQKRDDVV